MKKIYALKEHYGDEKAYLVLFLEPESLAEALEHLWAGNASEAAAGLREAAALYVGYEGEPPHRVYKTILEKEHYWEGWAEVEAETLEELEQYQVKLLTYPVLTGGEGLTLHLAFDWYSSVAGDIEAHALVHLDPEVLPRAAKAVV